MIRARGRYQVKLDAKGRFPVPARVRDAMARDCQDTLVMAYWRGRLKMFSLDDFEAIEAQVAGSGPFAAANEDAIYAFIANASEAVPDKSGRVRVPPTLLEWAGIDREAVVLGALGVLEVWNPERLAARTDASRKSLDESGGLEWLSLPRGGAPAANKAPEGAGS